MTSHRGRLSRDGVGKDWDVGACCVTENYSSFRGVVIVGDGRQTQGRFKGVVPLGSDHDKMKQGDGIKGEELGVGFLLSLALHVVVAMLLGWWLVDGDTGETEPEEEEEPSMEVVLDEEEPWEESDAPLEQMEEPKDDDEEEHEEEPRDIEERERYAVEQEVDGEMPEEADHISEDHHRAEEEMVAEETTLEEVEIPEETESEEQERDTERELAMEAPEQDDDEEVVEDVEEDSADVEKEEQESMAFRDPSEMMEPAEVDKEEMTEADREAIFGSDAERRQAVMEASEGAEGAEPSRQGRQLLANWRENEEAMRASLENFVPHIQPGNHTSVNAYADPHANYIARLHREIHPKWAESFLPRISRAFSSRHDINDPSLETVIEIVIDPAKGEVVETGRVQPSGVEIFDAEALNITRNLQRVDDAPESMISEDGKIYVHWTFWRDQRQCGTFGARIYERHDG